MRAAFADQLVGENSKQQIFYNSFFFRILSEVFESVNQHVEKLVAIFLDPRINRTSVNVFERLAEILRVEVLLLQLHQRTENSFHLV